MKNLEINNIQPEEKPEFEQINWACDSAEVPDNQNAPSERGKERNFIFVKGRGVFLAVLTTLLLTNCSTPTENRSRTEENRMQTSQEPSKAQREYAADVESFRKESNRKIAANQAEIAELRRKSQNNDQTLKERYDEQTSELEERNEKLQKRMNDYRAEKQEDWASFRKEFSNDMNDLGQSIKNFRVD